MQLTCTLDSVCPVWNSQELCRKGNIYFPSFFCLVILDLFLHRKAQFTNYSSNRLSFIFLCNNFVIQVKKGKTRLLEMEQSGSICGKRGSAFWVKDSFGSDFTQCLKCWLGFFLQLHFARLKVSSICSFQFSSFCTFLIAEGFKKCFLAFTTQYFRALLFKCPV